MTATFSAVLAAALTLGAAQGPNSTQPSPERAPLTLERAILEAETHNREIAIADARLDRASAGIGAARANRRPRLGVEASYQRTDNPVQVFSNLLRQESFGAENFEIGRLNQPSPLDHWSAALRLEHPLWSGGRLRLVLETATHHHEAAQAARERTRHEVASQVTAAWTQAVLAQRRLEVAREATATAASHVTLVRDLYTGGLVVESDLLLAQVRESMLYEDLILAEAAVEMSRAGLNLLLGRSTTSPLDLPPEIELDTRAASDLPDLEHLLERAAERPDLDAAMAQRAAAATSVETARAARRPQVGLDVGWEANAEAPFGDDGFGHGGENWSVGVGFKVTLFDGGAARARVAETRGALAEAEHRAALLAEHAALEVERAYHRLRAARQRLELAARGAELARRSLEIVTDRYKEGLTTLPELLDAETALTAARLREVEVRGDLLMARAELDLASGTF